MTRKKILIIASILILFVGLWISFFVLTNKPKTIEKSKVPFPTSSPTLIPTKILPTSKPTQKLAQKINLMMSFTAQAPFGDWKDPRQQDGCEEASSLVAIKWARKQKFTKEEALVEIQSIAKYEEDKFGSYQDTSTKDTAERIIRGYFGYNNYRVEINIQLSDIIREITAGNAIIVPMNGQALGNPNYTAPGPDRHMLIIKGYDPIKKQIITNDVGTRQGENYAYDENVFYNSIRDYPTGNHLPILGITKSMIIVYSSN